MATVAPAAADLTAASGARMWSRTAWRRAQRRARLATLQCKLEHVAVEAAHLRAELTALTDG
eukprot:1781797-Alexandrium_andersonii.AAC.1